jgi:hypothetical protein
MLFDLKKEERMFISKIRKKKNIRDHVLRDETKNYINDVDEILFFIVSISKITTRCVCLKCLINVITNQEKKTNSFDQRIYTIENELAKQN